MPSDDDTRAAFLADILAHPDDDGPRLVFADWLSERGDPRGELINVQVALASATGGELARLANRSSDLLLRHGEAWLGEIRRVVRGVELKRGFVASINATGPMFGKCGALFDREPIEELRLINPAGRDLATLAKAKHLAKLRSLVFLDALHVSSTGYAEKLGTLLERLGTLESLDLRLDVDVEMVAATCAALETASLPALERLKLRVRAGDPTVIVGAVCKAKLPALRRLAAQRDTLGVLRAAFPAADVTALVD